MKQTVEQAANEYMETLPVKAAIKCGDIEDLESHIKVAFKTGYEWQSKQSPWIKIGDREHPVPNDKRCLLLLEDGSVVDETSDWEDKCLLVIAYMPIPSFDDILEANRDVLKRIKEKGD